MPANSFATRWPPLPERTPPLDAKAIHEALTARWPNLAWTVRQGSALAPRGPHWVLRAIGPSNRYLQTTVHAVGSADALVASVRGYVENRLGMVAV